MWCQIEHWVTLGCLYIGAVFYSMLISSILSILQTTYLASRHFEEKLIQLDGYMKTKSVPVALRAKVKDHFHFQNPGRMYFDEEEVLKVISPIHLKEMRQFEVARLAAKVPLLSSPSNQAFVRSLANSLVQRIVFPGQIIFEERSTGDTMYFISSGLVELYLPSQGSEDPYLAIGDGCVSLCCDILLVLLVLTWLPPYKPSLASLRFDSSLAKFRSCWESNAPLLHVQKHNASFSRSKRTT
jgi:hypothetical protein